MRPTTPLIWIGLGIGATVMLQTIGGAGSDPASRAPAIEPARSETGFLFKSFKHEGAEYKHVVFVPRGYTPDKDWPCVVFLHGAGECGKDGLKQVAQGLGQAILWNESAWPCIVVIPQKPEQGKQWEDYDAAVMGMLAQARKEYRIDASRISLTGLSQGGHGSWTLGAAHADVWSAVAPICGYVSRNRTGEAEEAEASRLAGALKGIPVWAFHGEADEVVKPEQTRIMVAAFKRVGVDIKASFYPGVNHGSWDRAYREEKDAGGLAAWLLAQKRAAP